MVIHMKSQIDKLNNFASVNKFAIATAPAIAQRMAGQYLSKKRAHEALQTSYRKTGSIDMSRIASYKTSDDIFTSKTIQREGKSHGVYLCIDFSSSMSGVVSQVAIQYLIIALFCKTANLPFTVATFTDRSYGYHRPAGPADVAGNYHSNLVQLVIADDSMSKSQLIEVFYHMVCASVINNHQYNSNTFAREYVDFLQRHFSMGGTPLADSHLATYVDAAAMRRQHQLENVTIMYITDGAGSGINVRDQIASGYANSVVCPFSGRRYDTPKGDSTGIISPINRMIRDHGLKIMNLFIADQSLTRSAADFYHSNDDRQTSTSYSNRAQFDAETLTIPGIDHKFSGKNTGIEVIDGLACYNKVIFASRNVFPVLVKDEMRFDEDASAQRVFKDSTSSNTKMALIGQMIVDEICREFSIKN